MFNDFEERTKGMTAVEILNYYRNLNHAEPQHTEQGILARAINEVLPRMVILPCKPMDDVYYLTTVDTEVELGVAEIFEGKVCSVTQESNNMWIFCRYYNGLTYHHTVEDIGESIFFTRADAEKALAGRSRHEGEHAQKGDL